MEFLLAFVLVAAVIAPLFYAYYQKKTGKELGKVKRSLIFNLSAFALMALVGIIIPIGGFVSAAGTGDASGLGMGLGFLSAALATGISGIAGGYAVAVGSTAAIGALTEDPKSFGKALIFVGLGEGVALYGFVIGLMIVTKL